MHAGRRDGGSVTNELVRLFPRVDKVTTIASLVELDDGEEKSQPVTGSIGFAN